jgi:hypothetical protein
MVEPIRRLSGPVPAEQKRGQFVWAIPLNDKPTPAWIQLFRSPGEQRGLINAQRIGFRDAELIFESSEAQVTTWLRHIDTWITAANAATTRADEQRWEERRRMMEKSEQQAQRVRDADKYRDL